MSFINSGLNPSLGIDNNGVAHVSYFGRNGLMYATNGSASWAASVVADSDVVRDHAIFVDQANKVHVSFYDPVTTSLKFATTALPRTCPKFYLPAVQR